MMSDDWQYMEEPVGDPHALCCRRCKTAREALDRRLSRRKRYARGLGEEYPEIGDLRQRADGAVEMLWQLHSDGRQEWVPAATAILSKQYLSYGREMFTPPITMLEALIAEGWSPPSEEEND